MINLIPPEQKKELLLQRNINLAYILGTIFVVSLLCLSLIFLFLKFYTLTYIVSQNNSSPGNNIINIESIKKEIVAYNLQINNLNSFYNSKIYFSKMISSLLGQGLPKGIYITNIASEIKNKKIESSVYGFAQTREDLTAFKNNIEANKNITSPYFSPDSWTKSDNINFYLTFQYENAK